MRPTLLAGLLSLIGVLGALAAGTPRALAQDAAEPAAPPPAEVAQEHVTWVEGWEAGRAAARERGRPMLVYVHRTSPP